jgi:protein-S-isoprenylcysteine O-methyltransferase Ste14
LRSGLSRRRFSDFLLFGVTLAELSVLALLTPSFAAADWIYISQHLIVLNVALTRDPPLAYDHSIPTSMAVVVSYSYPYAQAIYLLAVPGQHAWPGAGLVLTTISACLSLASLVWLGRLFGIRPALRGLAMTGPYRIVRHPMYLAYAIGDIGYNLEEWNLGTVLMVIAGWFSLIWRIQAEERILALDARYPVYIATVRHRLIPSLW